MIKIKKYQITEDQAAGEIISGCLVILFEKKDVNKSENMIIYYKRCKYNGYHRKKLDQDIDGRS